MAVEGIQPTCETFNCLVNVCAKSAGAGAGEKAVAHARVFPMYGHTFAMRSHVP